MALKHWNGNYHIEADMKFEDISRPGGPIDQKIVHPGTWSLYETIRPGQAAAYQTLVDVFKTEKDAQITLDRMKATGCYRIEQKHRVRRFPRSGPATCEFRTRNA